MANKRGKGESSDRFPFLGLQNHYGWWLQPWNQKTIASCRKVMTNLDTMLKSRDITLLTKVHIVKAMVFPVVTYDLWELDRKEGRMPENWCLWTVCWRRLLKVPWTARRSNQSILREINPEYSQKGLMLKLKLQYFSHLMHTDNSLEKSLMLGKIKGRRREGHQRIRWLDSIIDAMNMNLGKLREMVRDREAWCATVHGITKRHDWVTETTNRYLVSCKNEEGNGNPLQYSCWGNPVDRGAWRATVHCVAKSLTQLSN